MDVDSKKLAKAIVNTFSHEVGTALLPTGYVLEKITEDHCITKHDLAIIKNNHYRIKNTLNKFVKLANSDFLNVRIKSDRSGFCSYIDLNKIDTDSQ